MAFEDDEISLLPGSHENKLRKGCTISQRVSYRDEEIIGGTKSGAPSANGTSRISWTLRPTRQLDPIIIVGIFHLEQFIDCQESPLPSHILGKILKHFLAMTIPPKVGEEPHAVHILTGIINIWCVDNDPVDSILFE